MNNVTVSPKFQVVIPLAVREALGIKVGEKMQVFCYDGRVEFIPTQPMRAARGLLRGIDTHIEREDDRV